ncbi:fibronectin type III domain-containing protein [Actinoplanes siamensis]|uniref:Fibronectin type-III domain-containing protein n=1 Tax=Actinoplanes siamensis TaxID=1223317 RepID=A0A919TNN8_9ACTN|nr:fibronectin type III domain-containing protein [Actinoplanes siamensis]GIF09726.1 hypothetical protein Asi03nite_72640 [Actinoplanes siamensis]
MITRSRLAVLLAALLTLLLLPVGPAGAAPSRRAPQPPQPPAAKAAAASTPVGELAPATGQFYPVQPVVASADVALTANTPKDIKLVGIGEVPNTEYLGVLAQVRVSGHTANGNVRVYPPGSTTESVTLLNYTNGKNASTMDELPTSTGGKLTFVASTAVKLRIVVVGWYSGWDPLPATAGATYLPLAPVRVLNAARLNAGATTVVPIAGANGVGATADVSAVNVVVAETSAAAAGYVQAYPTGATVAESTAALYYATGEQRSQAHVIPVGADGSITVKSSAASNVTVYLQGYYQKPTGPLAGATFRESYRSYIHSAAYTAGATKTATAALGGNPASDVVAVAARISAINATAAGTVQTWPSGTAPVDASLLYNTSTPEHDFSHIRVAANGTFSVKSSAAATVEVLQRGLFVKARTPSAPIRVSAVPGAGQAAVSWANGGDGGAAVTGYTVIVSPGGRRVPVTGTSTVVDGLDNGTEYTFAVVATNAVGNSPASAPSDRVTPAQPRVPGAPYVTDTYARDTAVRVSWSPPDTGATGVTRYVVTAAPGGATAEADGSATEAIVSGLTNGTAYTFTVTAVNGIGAGAASPPSDPVRPVAASVPLKPSLGPLVRLNGRIDAQWTAPTDGGSAITGYTVTVQPGGRTIAIPGDTTVAGITGLTNGTAYTISVTATNAAGTGAPATFEPATPVAARAPAAPTDVRAAVADQGQVRVTWTPPQDVGTSAITGYTVKAAPGTVTATTTGTSALLTGLTATTNYTFTVTATNAAGASVASTATQPVLPKLTYKDAFTVLTAEQAAAIRSVHQDGTLIFDGDDAPVYEGDVFVVPPTPLAERGMLLRATGVSTSGGLTAVSTVEAGLDEIYTDGSLALNSVLDTSDVQSFVPLVPGVRLREPTLHGRTLAAGAPAASSAPNVGLRDGTLVVELAYDIGRNVDGNGGKAETQFELTPKGSADVDITSSGINTKFRLTAATRIETRFKAGAFREYDKEWTIAKIKGRCFDVQLGPVPVIICLEFDVKIRFELDGSVGVTLAADYKREFGAEISTKNTTVTATKIDDGGSGSSDLRLYGEAQAKLLIPVECTLFFYGAAGPGIVARPYLQVKADTTQNPWWEVRAGAELGAFVKSKRFFGKEIDWRNDHLLDAFYTLKNSGGPFIGLLVTPTSQNVEVNTPLDFNVSITGYPDDTPIHWRVVEGPGTIDSDGRFTSDRNGVATVEAYSPADIFHPDLYARGSAIVGGGPPGAPGAPTATAGPLSANVKWTPAGNDGGHPVNGYVLTTYPPTATTRVEGPATTARVRGLAPGVSYLVYVRATNDRGAGPPAVSNAVVPAESPVQIGYRTNVAVDELGKPDVRAMAGAHGVAVSGSGRFAFFLVEAQSNLAPPEIYVAGSAVQYLVRKDLTTGEIVVVSRALDGRTPVTAGGFVRMPGSTSALPPGFTSNYDGSVVAYATGSGFGSLYVHNVSTKATWNATAGLAAGGYPGAPRLSDDGTVVAFAYGDVTAHIYRRVPGGAAQQIDNCFLQSSCTASPDIRKVGWFSMSGSGTRIAYEDAALVSGVAQRHALLWDASTGATTDLTATPRAKEESWRPAISGDGTTISFSYTDPSSTAAKKTGIVIKPVGGARVSVTDIVLTPPAGNQVAADELSADGRTLAYSQGTELETGFVYSASLGTSAKIGRPSDKPGFYDLSFDLTADGRMLVWSASYACDDDCGGGVWAQYFS